MKTLGKRGRGLDPAIMMWIMSTLGIGPGVGDVHFLAKEGSAYESWVRDELRVDSAHTHFELAAAYDAVTTRRNDVILVTPGNYLETATLDWDKDYVHLLGLTNENVYSDWSLLGTTIYTTDTAVDYVIDMSGERNSIHNICLNNYGANASCLSSARINGYGNSFFNTHFTALMLSEQIGETDASCLSIGKGAHYALFKGCIIGQNEWGTRTDTAQGTLLFSGATAPAPANGKFVDCLFRQRCEVAGVPMVWIAAPYSIGRDWIFENCVFTNFWLNWADKTTRVFQFLTSASTCFIGLRNCSAYGFDEWQSADHGEWVVSDMPIVGRGGGLALLANAPSGT